MENNSPIILAIDQGSGSTKALAINLKGEVLAHAEIKIVTSFPHPGWVEQDPEEIWQSVVTASKEITKAHKISAVGLSVQRESVLFWDRTTGKALSKVITWQALFAHQGWKTGVFKATFGTGTSLMGVTEINPQTIAWSIDKKITRAVEANILSTGSTLVWLAELLGTTPDELAKLAPESTEQVEIVPAFNGLGAPWWDREATSVISGLTRGSKRADLAAAALRSTAAQINDVLEDFAQSNIEIDSLYADGGGARNEYLMQMLADLSGKRIRSSQLLELSAFGAAMVAAIGAGLATISNIEKIELKYSDYTPAISESERQIRLKTWRKAVQQSRLK